jgi:hypothetical protein
MFGESALARKGPFTRAFGRGSWSGVGVFAFCASLLCSSIASSFPSSCPSFELTSLERDLLKTPDRSVLPSISPIYHQSARFTMLKLAVGALRSVEQQPAGLWRVAAAGAAGTVRGSGASLGAGPGVADAGAAAAARRLTGAAASTSGATTASQWHSVAAAHATTCRRGFAASPAATAAAPSPTNATTTTNPSSNISSSGGSSGGDGLVLDDSAVKRLQQLQRQAGAGKPVVLRIEVEGGGCSGFQYKFRLDDATNPDDR